MFNWLAWSFTHLIKAQTLKYSLCHVKMTRIWKHACICSMFCMVLRATIRRTLCRFVMPTCEIYTQKWFIKCWWNWPKDSACSLSPNPSIKSRSTYRNIYLFVTDEFVFVCLFVMPSWVAVCLVIPLTQILTCTDRLENQHRREKE